ncbi:ChrR family anti-sigma-E factor [Oceaniglobus indicus]|uniref:ChrR family anti-sigma-E factor n=1 Tax=Oceaniglobus indicus TaxID=2047749 RepID=UPI000C17ABF3|nr:ChrR family anti-sigma-E factor [Oceaniglobus indicus]
MTKIEHHLSEQMLMAHAAGTLPEAFDVLIATHISLCDTCRVLLETYETLGGAVLDAGEECAMGSDALTATLARIEAAPADVPARPRIRDAVFPAPLRDYVGGDADAVRWRPLGGGVRQARLKTAGGATLRLLNIPAGTAVPDHGHRGTELTLVLQGAFRDADDRFARGDVETANADLHHHPVAEAGVDCICLAATDAPLKFDGLIQRIAQPFLGI